MAAKALVVAFGIFLGWGIITNGAPTESTHPFCRIVWLVGLPCAQVNTALLTQIKSMGSYKLDSVSPGLIKANHTSAVGQVENVNFTMMSTAMGQGCHVDGLSTSTFWFSLFDNGTNYCNLHNVITGSGLDKAPGFTEFTNEWLCLGYGVSACKRV